MSAAFARGYFVAGTDTGVGKTYVACRLIEAFKQRGLRVAAMKPVAAGVEADGMNADVRLLMAAANVAAPPQAINPYCFAPAIAPHIAAQRSGVSMRLEVIEQAYGQLAARADVVIVEGAGGLLVPLDEETGMEAIPMRLHLPVVLVVGIRLGCLNHALLTCEAIARRGLELAGWVANVLEPEMDGLEENLHALSARISAPCLGRLGWNEPAARAGLAIEELANKNISR